VVWIVGDSGFIWGGALRVRYEDEWAERVRTGVYFGGQVKVDEVKGCDGEERDAIRGAPE